MLFGSECRHFGKYRDIAGGNCRPPRPDFSAFVCCFVAPPGSALDRQRCARRDHPGEFRYVVVAQAKTAMTDVAAKMTRDELDEAKRRERQWKARPEGKAGGSGPN